MSLSKFSGQHKQKYRQNIARVVTFALWMPFINYVIVIFQQIFLVVQSWTLKLYSAEEEVLSIVKLLKLEISFVVSRL